MKLTRPDGREVFSVRSNVLGKDKKKICATVEEARLIAAQWLENRVDQEFKPLPTRLTPTQLKEAEFAEGMFSEFGLGLKAAALWFRDHYTRPAAITWKNAIEQYKAERGKIGLSPNQVGNVAFTAQRLATFLGREQVGNPTLKEIETFLATEGAEWSDATFNGQRGNLGAFFAWLMKRGFIPSNPVLSIDKRKIRRNAPTVLQPEAVERLMRDLEATAPAWIPYVALCVFGGMRPGTRFGEAARLDADLKAGNQVIFPDGIQVSGKANGIRLIRWDITGPLKAWLDAYPLKNTLWPAVSGQMAAKIFAPIRKRNGLTTDVLRHTAISAMLYAPKSSYAKVTDCAGNSEGMIRKHYRGKWSPELTTAMHAILPRPVAAPVQTVDIVKPD